MRRRDHRASGRSLLAGGVDAPSRRGAALPWLLVVLALLSAAVSYSILQLQATERAAERATAQREEATRLAARLSEAANAGETGDQSERERPAAPMNQVIGEAVAARGISAGESGLRVDPGRPSRVGRTAWERVPLRLSLRGLTLEQTAGLLTDVSERVPGLIVEELRLSAPRRGSGSLGTDDANALERWNVEAELGRLRYRPAEGNL